MLVAIIHTTLGVFIHDSNQPQEDFIIHLTKKYKHHQNVKISIKKTAPSLV